MIDENTCEFKDMIFHTSGLILRKFPRLGWQAIPQTNNNGCGYNQIRVEGKLRQRHRLIVAAFNPAFDIDNTDLVVDHIDGDTLNNAFDNLRVVTRQGNAFNTKAKGYHRHNDRFAARICVNGKQKYLGLYDTEEAARAAYLAAKELYHVIEPVC